MDRDLAAFPSQQKLARAMGYESTRHLRRALEDSVEKGFLVKTKVGPRRIEYRAAWPDVRRVADGEANHARGEAARVIRDEWWRAKEPPEPGWSMGREYSGLDPIARRHGWPIVLEAMRRVREVYDLTNGTRFTGKLVLSRKTRTSWSRCLHLARQELDRQRGGVAGGDVEDETTLASSLSGPESR